MERTNVATHKEFIDAAVNHIAAVIASSTDICRIGLSGGNTPKPIYEALAARDDIDFSRVDFYLVDERAVPANDPASNQHMIRESLIAPLRQRRQGGFHYFDTALPIEETLYKYEEELDAIPNHELDLIILGIGSDGHTASLFPHSAALTEDRHCVAYSTTNKYDVKDRLTMTFPIIMAAKKLLLLATKEKQDILEKLLSSDNSVDDLPAEQIEAHPGLTILYADV